jgi:FKBP-type peptidyl-prolyl cis-trans isomerase
MIKLSKLVFLICLVAAVLISCNKNELPDNFKGYTKLENGIYYKFLHQAGGKTFPQKGDVCLFHSSIFKGQVLLSSTYQLGNMAERMIDSDETGFPIQKVLPKMAIGDSLSLVILSDSLSTLPPDFASGEWMNVVVKLVEIQPLAQRQSLKQKELAKMKRHPKGFFWIRHKEGNGVLPESGDEVTFSFVLRKGDKIRYKTENDLHDKVIIPAEQGMQTPLHTAIKELSVGDKVTISYEVEKMPIDLKDAFLSDGFFDGDLMTMDIEIFAIRDSAIVAKEQAAAVEKEQKERVALLKRGDQLQEELKQNIERVKSKKLALKNTESGLQYIIHTKGSGPTKHEGEKISMHYIGFLLTSVSKFDSSFDRGAPLDFVVGPSSGMITGMNEAASMLSKGAKATFFIPSHLAYGDEGNGEVIPGGATLVFYVEVME